MGQLTEVLKKGYAAFSRGDLEETGSYFAENIKWEVNSQSDIDWLTTIKGREAVLENFTRLNEDVEFTRIEPLEYLEVGNRVAVRVEADIKARRTGQKENNVHELHWWTFNNEHKVTHCEVYLDTARAEKLLGVTSHAGVMY